MCAGEGAGQGSKSGDGSSTFSTPYLNVDIPLDGMGFVSIPASEIISPVFTLWTTLVIMYIGGPLAAQSRCTFHPGWDGLDSTAGSALKPQALCFKLGRFEGDK